MVFFVHKLTELFSAISSEIYLKVDKPSSFSKRLFHASMLQYVIIIISMLTISIDSVNQIGVKGTAV